MTTPGQQLTPGDDQNPPVFGVPDGAYVGTAGDPNAITDLNGLTEAEAKNRMRSPAAPSFASQRDGVWGHVQDMIDMMTGNYGGTKPPFVDGQLALNDRLDLLTDVSGYCSTYQDRNWRVGGGTRKIPFGKQLGPYKNAHPGDDGIYLDAPGTWRIDATATVGGGSGSGACRFIISVRDPDGEIYSEQWLDASYMSTSRTWAWNTTVVIPGTGYHVRVYWGHPALWWTLYGGTHRSRLSVNRWDMNTGDFVPDTDVPDGGNL